ncbi:dipeptidase [Streptomyces olivaceus]
MDGSRSRTVRLDAAGPELTPRALPTQLGRIRKGKLNTVLATVTALEPPQQAINAVNEWWKIDHALDRGARVATSVEKIRQTVAAGDLAVVLHFQGSAPLGGQVEMVDTYARLGVRVIQLTYNYAELAGDGCLEERNAGLTAFGRKIVHRMQNLGVTVDLSHAGERTCLETLSIAQRPAIISHGNARAVCDSPRNVSDEVIRAVAATGGVVGLCAFPAFVSSDPVPTLDQLINHAVHISDLVGAKHVGLGFDFADEDESDYDYFGYDERYYPRPPWTWPVGISWWEDAVNIAPALRRRGFSEEEVTGIMGENFMRAFEQTWNELN